MGSKWEVFVHLVWATEGRRQLLIGEVEEVVHEAIRAKCAQLGCAPCTVGGTADHVHLLARLHPSVAFAHLAAQAKGASSHAANLHLAGPPGLTRFGWQRGYGAFSISPQEVPTLHRYILDQPRHHSTRATDPALEHTPDP
jgi:REP element-mobilizing transposase RayT